MSSSLQQERLPPQYPPLVLAAAACALLGVGVALLGIFVDMQPDTQRGLRQIGIGMVAFGVGEFLNHRPGNSSQHLEGLKKPVTRTGYYERTPCTLGNLLVIFSMLIFFLGLGKIISF